MLLVAACASEPTNAPEPVQTVVPSFAARSATAIAGDFTLEVRVQEPAVGNQPLQIGAVLTYRGQAPTVRTYTAGGIAPVLWELRGFDGTLVIHGPVPGSCGEFLFERNREYWIPYVKGAAYDPNGRDAEFFKRFLSGPDLLLPVGTWEAVAKLDLAIGDCTGPRVETTVHVPFEVGAGGVSRNP